MGYGDENPESESLVLFMKSMKQKWRRKAKALVDKMSIEKLYIFKILMSEVISLYSLQDHILMMNLNDDLKYHAIYLQDLNF